MLTRGRFIVVALLLGPASAQAQVATTAAPFVPSETCARLAAPAAIPAEADTVSAVVDCAYAFSDNNDHQTATTLFDLAIRTGHERADAHGLARAYKGLSTEYFSFGTGDGADDLMLESLRVSEQAGSLADMANAENGLGQLATRRAAYDQALEHHTRSLELWTRAGDDNGVAIALNNVGATHRSLGDFASALEYLQLSLDRLERRGDLRAAATVLDNMGIARRRLGDYQGGFELAQRGLAIRETLNDRVGMAKSLDSLGEAFEAQGNWGAALASIGRSLDIRRELHLVHGTAESLNNIAVVYEAVGNYEQAVRFLREALALNTDKVGSASLAAEIQTHLGEVYLRNGQLVQARQVLLDSVAITERNGFREQGANARFTLGRTYLASRRLTAGRVEFERALAVRDQLGDRGGRAAALIELADLDRRQQRLTQAGERASEAVAIAASSEIPELEWKAVTLVGRLQLASGKPEAARQSFDHAIGIIEAVRDRNPGSEFARGLFFADRLEPYHQRLALAVSNGRPSEALSYAERLKARALVDILRGGQSITTAMTGEQRERERSLRMALASASSALEQAARASSPNEARLAMLRRARNDRRLEYEAFEARLYAELPTLQANRSVLPPLSATDARALVPTPRSAVVEYVVGRERTFAIVVTRAAVQVFTLPVSAADLTNRVGAFASQLAGRDLRVAVAARQLHQQLLAPLGIALAGVDNLIVVPDGVLWELPFQALQSADGRYLVEDKAISYAPSLMALREMMKRARRPPATHELIAFGNAAGEGDDALPDAEMEVRRIAQLYGGSSRVLTGADAREDYWASDAGNYRIVHVAAHGLLDDASPLYSSLQFARGAGTTDQDGRLEAWEVMKVPLAADLVVFSACDTARGRIAPGEGILGLMWATFVAGSRATLVSQWRVDSKASTDLMIHFYQEWTGGTAAPSKARALQSASVAMLHSPGRSHPFYWAGFILGGDGR